MTWTEWAGIVSTIGLVVLGFMKFRQSLKVDAVSAQSGVATGDRAGIDQLLKGSNDLIDQLQQENEKLRLDLENRRIEADARAARIETMTLELARLRKKYGNGNNDTPNPPNKEKL